jgi:aromatic-L-amino-acid decarboxylase
VCAGGPPALAGLARVDSLVLDPHKWLFQPYDVGCLFMRAGALGAAFRMDPEYLIDVMASRGEVDMRNRTLELTRRSRGLKLWLTFRTYGMEAISAAVGRGIELAEIAEALIRDDERFTLVTPAQLGIVTFALAGGGEDIHREAAARLAADGFAAVTATSLKDRSVLRLCTINPQTTEADLRGTLDRLADADLTRERNT